MTIRYKCDTKQCFENDGKFITSDDEGRCPCCGEPGSATVLQPFTRVTSSGRVDFFDSSLTDAKTLVLEDQWTVFRGHLKELKP